MKRILFPTDFSPTARNAFSYACALAAELGAKIDLLSIYHLPVADASSVPPEYIERMLEDKKHQLAIKMAEFLKICDPHSLGKTKIEYGIFVAQEIADIAREGRYDLIVMGTKGEHNAFEKILGSVTSNTMMQAPCPVLAVPEGAVYQPIRNIAYAADFNPGEDHAVQELLAIAEPFGALVHFVHVDTRTSVPAGELEPFHGSMRQFADFAVVSNASLQEGMDQFLHLHDIDLLALFIPRRRLWEKLFHSSFSKRMAFHTRVPLLIFHE